MGNTPLIFAAAVGSIESVRRLLEAGADPLAKDQDGATALDQERRMGYSDIAAILERSTRR